MKLNYTLHHRDYLKHLLYSSSKSKSFNNSRRKGLVFTISFYVLIAVVFYLADYIYISYGVIAASIVSIFFYPTVSRNQYENRFTKYISETLKNGNRVEISLELKDQFIELSDISGEVKLKYSSLEKIIEITTHFFIKIRNGGTVIIPKTYAESENIEAVIKMLTEKIEIEYSKELDWDWK